MPAARTPSRRRQRSVRVTVSVTLLTLVAVIELITLAASAALDMSAAGSLLLTTLGSVTALLVAGAALRVMWTEVLHSRREHAADRARTAQDYRRFSEQRSREHAEVVTAITGRLADSHMTMHELEHQVLVEQRRTGLAQSKLLETARRLSTMQTRVDELEREVALRLQGEGAEVTELRGRAESGTSLRPMTGARQRA